MTAPPPSIQLLPYAGTGGTERHVEVLVQALAAEAPIGVVAPPGPAHTRWRESGVESFPYEPLHPLRPSAASSLHRALAAAAARCGTRAVIHAHGAPELLPFAQRAAPGRVIFTAHGHSGRGAGISYWLTARAALRWADRIVAVSLSEAHRLSAAGLPRQRIVVIHNGIPDPAQPPLTGCARTATRRALLAKAPHWTDRAQGELDPAARLIGTVGRLHPSKGLSFLIDAFAQLVHGPWRGRMVLVIIGAGPAEAACRALAQRRGVAGEIAWIGARPDAARLSGAFDVAVFPSLAEAFGLACLEAMAHAVPVVATRLGGHQEVLGPHPSIGGEHGSAGLFVPPRDAGAIARAIHRILTAPGLGRRLGRAGRARFEALFTASAMAERIAALYDELAAAGAEV